jgi:hypothetical protein
MALVDILADAHSSGADSTKADEDVIEAALGNSDVLRVGRKIRSADV